MEYILAFYLSTAASFGIPGTPNGAITLNSSAQCNAAAAAFEASGPQAEATCSAIGDGRYGLQLYVYGSTRAGSGVGLQNFATSTACNNAKTAFEASDGDGVDRARAACLVVPIGGRND